MPARGSASSPVKRPAPLASATCFFARLDDSAHIGERGHTVRFELGVKLCRLDLRSFRLKRFAGSLPAIEAAIQHINRFGTHDAQHPPDARRGEEAGAIIDHDRIGVGNPKLADFLGKKIRGRQGVRKARLMIGNGVLIEEDGAWNVAAGIFLLSVAFMCRQIPGRIDDAEVRCSKLLLDPIRRNDETAFIGAHDVSPRNQAASAGLPKRMRKRRFSLPFFSILAM